MSQYGKAQYWQQRYTRDVQSFDWYQRYFALRDIIGQHITVDKRILNVGAGNSRLSQQMFDDGYDSITNIDISIQSIKLMSDKYKQKGQKFKYIQMDVRAMDFPQNSFDAVIDKGTFDSVLCGQGSNTNALKMITQIYKVLSGDGVYIMISHACKQARLSYLQRPQFDWSVKVQQIGKPTIAATITKADPDNPTKNNHYIYICSRGKKNQGGQVEQGEKVQEKKA